ncbi:unnamed protein product [Nesidiocoris tenuis]|uniref:Uncharacterized protein n=1 Tax=Nesidiocoris tenuis TaxID=355587 RepID=A0A6H5GJJ7_9HEMI|nr:unnamed protein product [Nesidiocoris tenuis]
MTKPPEPQTENRISEADLFWRPIPYPRCTSRLVPNWRVGEPLDERPTHRLLKVPTRGVGGVGADLIGKRICDLKPVHHVYNKLPNEQVDISWDGLESQCCRSSLLDWRQRLSVRNVCLPVLPHPLHNLMFSKFRENVLGIEMVEFQKTCPFNHPIFFTTKWSRSIRKGGPIRWKRRKATSTCGFHNCFKRRSEKCVKTFKESNELKKFKIGSVGLPQIAKNAKTQKSH